MATSTVIPGDITTLKGDVSKAKEDISSINGKVSTLQTDMTSAKQDISSRYTKTEVDNKLKNKVEVNDLESGRYGGDFYPLTGREAFYLWNLATTTAAANLYLNPDPAISSVLRSTSSIRYKHSVETIDLIFRMRPVWYRSQCENDRRDWGFYGLIAEEVGEIAPQFVHWRPANEDDAPEAISSNGLVAEGVMYERLVVPLIHHIQKLTERVDELESELKLLLTSRSDIR
ncbi:TPA: tail fiber domain-containing protein [Escherichia coli]|nr:tail fiber domain-containing protein [Escherichia coli]HCO9692254.1 tail fiber domain-containing protein [Escherichia coli]HCP0099907.1 tail fiber domain-containing protein [Escherichia coli]